MTKGVTWSSNLVIEHAAPEEEWSDEGSFEMEDLAPEESGYVSLFVGEC
jgi:hypothetical protein